MKKRQAARTAMLLFLCVLTAWALCCPAAPAEEEEEDEGFYVESIEAWDRPSTLAELGLSQSAPLFLAPFDDALRPETGKTEIQPGDRFTILSAAETWRMIRTEDRIGWIKTDQEHGVNYDVFPADTTSKGGLPGCLWTKPPWRPCRSFSLRTERCPSPTG